MLNSSSPRSRFSDKVLLERIGKEPTSWYGPDRVDTIDGAKLRIINALAKLSNAAQIPFVLPTTLTQESFWSKEDADKPPEIPEDRSQYYGGQGS